MDIEANRSSASHWSIGAEVRFLDGEVRRFSRKFDLPKNARAPLPLRGKKIWLEPSTGCAPLATASDAPPVATFRRPLRGQRSHSSTPNDAIRLPSLRWASGLTDVCELLSIPRPTQELASATGQSTRALAARRGGNACLIPFEKSLDIVQDGREPAERPCQGQGHTNVSADPGSRCIGLFRSPSEFSRSSLHRVGGLHDVVLKPLE